jgi:hypothetical protein
MLRRKYHHLAAALTLVALGGCSTDNPTSAVTAGSSAAVADASGASATLLECPPATDQSTTSVVDALGGVLSVGGTSVVIPANAVLAPTSFTLTVPASRYVEIEVTAGDADHFVFSRPVLVTIDYGRCGDSSLFDPPHQAWNIDPGTKALLERMSGVDVKLAHTVVFSTIHFSGYALAD